MSGYFSDPAKVERFQVLWDAGHSQSEIARTMRTTTGTVAGLVYRMKLTRPRPSGKKRKRTLYEPFATPAPAVDVAFPAYAPIAAYESGAPKAMAALDTHQCRFPIGDPRHADFHFCGGTQKAGSVYCEHHHSIAYEPRARTREANKQTYYHAKNGLNYRNGAYA